jgi:hypothetical protein
MNSKTFSISAFLLMFSFNILAVNNNVGIWMKFEKEFVSNKSYNNPLYDVTKFTISFVSPSGRTKQINGFWDGEKKWKVRFCPDEIGTWYFISYCSDKKNAGLHKQKGSFKCVANKSNLDIYKKGVITRPKGEYYLSYSDGTPFFWVACTAWNGALKSSEKEWETYLKNRKDFGYSVIQFVTTQWRGCEANSLGQVAFTGSGHIEVNPEFFQYLDKKIDRINAYGLVAAPVLLWALPFGQGRDLSPGYYLPQNEAILLAKYIVARYGGNHVAWILGGDGRYINEYEQRWKNIGRGVFGEEHPGIVAQHPHGRSWIGKDYIEENWLDIIGYQSSHSNEKGTVDWINKGPMSKEWDKIPAKPIINLEPNYEEIGFKITATDVRNASYWSLLATPTAGITYGANGIWPWLRSQDEPIQNHGSSTGYSPWSKSIKLPGSKQIGYLAKFFKTIDWWRLRPAPEILTEQPGDTIFNHFIAVSKTTNNDLIIAYLPVQSTIKLYNPFGIIYYGEWFDPVKNIFSEALVESKNGIITVASDKNSDMVLVLRKK